MGGNENDADHIELGKPVSTEKFPESAVQEEAKYKEALEDLRNRNQVAIVGFWNVDMK